SGWLQLGGEGALVDLGRIELARGSLAGDRPGGVDDLGAAAVVDAELQGEPVVVAGVLLGVLQLVDDAAPQPRPASGPADAHPGAGQLVAPAPDDILVEAHEEADLFGRAPPVLRGERVSRHGRYAQLHLPRTHI